MRALATLATCLALALGCGSTVPAAPSPAPAPEVGSAKPWVKYDRTFGLDWRRELPELAAVPEPPEGIDGWQWAVRATVLGVALHPTEADRAGVYEGFEFRLDDYPSLSGLGYASQPRTRLSPGFVEWRAELHGTPERRVSVTVVVGQGTCLDMRRYFLRQGCIPPGSMIVATGFRPGASEGFAIGQISEITRYRPSVSGFFGGITFVRRNVMVHIEQDKAVIDAAKLAKEIDLEIQRRPLIADLKESSLRPRFVRFSFAAAETTVLRQVRGSVSTENPVSGELATEYQTRLGAFRWRGEEMTYYGQHPGTDEVVFLIANRLNLSAEARATFSVGP